MSDQINPRTARVRESIIEAAQSLVAQRPVDEISLTEIAETAQVSRPTVYNQFRDTPSLVAEATIEFMEDVFIRIDNSLSKEDHNSVAYLDKLMSLFVQEVYSNRSFCRNAMHGPSSTVVSDYVVVMLEHRMDQGLVGKRLSPAGPHAADYRTTLSAGVVWLLVRWLDSDFLGENEPGRFAKRLSAVLINLSAAQNDEAS